MKKQEKEGKKEKKQTLEELLNQLRNQQNWNYWEVVERLEDHTLTEKEIKKWENGLKYPEIAMLYKLSEIYEIPIEKLIEAKNTSFQEGSQSIHKKFIHWLCFSFHVTLRTAQIMLIIFYVGALFLSFWIFLQICYSVG